MKVVSVEGALEHYRQESVSMAGKSKKEKGNEAVRQFRIREKAKELADKEKAERLRKENLELESKVASHQQDLDFFVSVVKAHVDVEGDAFLNADPCLREIFWTSD